MSFFSRFFSPNTSTRIRLVSTSFSERVGLDQSSAIEPDSTFPVGALNKLLQLCLNSQPFYLLPPSFPPHLRFYLPSFLSFHLLRPSRGWTFSLITTTPVCEILTKSCLITHLIYAAAHNLTAHRSVIMCLKYNRQQQRLFWPPANEAGT